MNNLVANFNQILEFGKKYDLPMTKKKAVLREYLQTKILGFIYSEKISAGLIFVGGTALRLTENLNRFSEDLDFDLNGLEFEEVKSLVEKVHQKLERENVAVELYENRTEDRLYHEFRFPNLLFDLDLSQQETEKLMIKFDYEKLWRNHQKEVKVINRYGYLVKSVSIPLDQHLVQKLTAYLGRKQTQPRDIYDIVWLIAQDAEIDWDFARANDLDEDLVDKAMKKFGDEKKSLPTYQARLEPFLIKEDHLDKLDLFPELLFQLK